MTKRNPSQKSSESHKKSKVAGKKAKAGHQKQTPGCRRFCTEQKSHRHAEFDSLSAKEQMDALAVEWHNLSAEEKQAYEKDAPAHESGSSSHGKGKAGGAHHRSAKKRGGVKKAKKTTHKSANKKVAHHHQQEHVHQHESHEAMDHSNEHD